MTFKTGDKVRVTPEYAAWYESTVKQISRIKPEDALIVVGIEDDGDIRVSQVDVRVPVVGWALPEHLVPAESETP